MSEIYNILVDIMSEQSAASRANERIGFEEAFALHHRTVFRAARSVVADPGIAEDVTQETFIRLYKNLDSLDNDEMLKPWLIRVAINLARNAVRGTMRANTREDNYVKEYGPQERSSVEMDFEENAGVNDIYRALAHVKEPLRSCLVLKQQGLSYKEIATSLDLNVASIGTFVARARQEFSKYYSGKA
ncbi:MAG TPA: sigma-70 family RNA polymerase sigma factor [Pyrinomonadaceae bacterium]|nr:sigma-70 family RNA polymerase sigma factor [Pyrinomonadaceae bacterium]